MACIHSPLAAISPVNWASGLNRCIVSLYTLSSWRRALARLRGGDKEPIDARVVAIHPTGRDVIAP